MASVLFSYGLYRAPVLLAPKLSGITKVPRIKHFPHLIKKHKQAYPNSSSKLLLDIDDTIFFNPKWGTRYFNACVARLIKSGYSVEAASDIAERHYNYLQYRSKVYPVEEDTIEILNTLSRQFPTLLLTKRHVDLADITFEHLMQLGFKINPRFSELSIEKDGFTINRGIIYRTPDEDKGRTLCKVLKYLSLEEEFLPENIYYLDDNEENVTIVKKILADRYKGINLLAGHYTYTPQLQPRMRIGRPILKLVS